MRHPRHVKRLLALVLIPTLLVACSSSATQNPGTAAPTAVPTAVATTAATPQPATPAITAAPTSTAEASLVVSTGTYTKEAPPDVFNAAEASKYSGVTVTYYGDANVGIGAELDQLLSKKFTEQTGINVTIVPGPEDVTERYAAYQRFFQAQSSDIDALIVDVIWPGALAPNLVDLSSALSRDALWHYPSIIENDTVDGKLVAIPWGGDFGMLYYRTDLLEKYGYSAPPQTWEELEQMAAKIQEGEQAANPNFAGFVFQGAAYEGLTCDAMEWLFSSGGGTVVDASGQVTINNPAAVEMLNKVKGWVGTIAPRGVTTYKEEDARNAFQGGNAAFLRNWPYVWTLGNGDDSAIKGKFQVAPLPAAAGQEHSGTVGGWQLGVSRFSKNPDAAIQFIRYLASPEVQKYRAIVTGYTPTIPAVANDQYVLEAIPYLQSLAEVVRTPRPSTPTGENYNQVSTALFQGVNEILNGKDAATVVPQIEQNIKRILGQ